MTAPYRSAAERVTASLLAAAWREDLHGIRTRAADRTSPDPSPMEDGVDGGRRDLSIDLPGGALRVTATVGPFGQLTDLGPIRADHETIDEPVRLLRLLTSQAPGQLERELRDAVAGLAAALPRHAHLTAALAGTARDTGADTTIALATRRRAEPGFLPCRFFEPLAVDGHHLHPCARTRLGWNTDDRNAYDLETTVPIGMRFVAARRDALAPTTGDTDLSAPLAALHPPLLDHRDDAHVLIAVHPWQHRRLRHGPGRELYDSGTLRDLPVPELEVAPTASIRTLVTGDGTYLKCSLSIHITSTRRGISPATVHNGPVLSRLLSTIIDADPLLRPRLAVLTEPAGASLPHGHPAQRELSCLVRTRLTDVTVEGELPVPATALPAISPVTGHSVVAELVAASRLDAADFLRRYTEVLAKTVIHLAAGYGIGVEAHLQNCVPTFRDGVPQRIIVRDLGGGRLLLPRLAETGHRPELHPASVIVAADAATVRAKVAYTVFQNHLAAITTALARDCGLPQRAAWRVIAEVVAAVDMPSADRADYTAATVGHKALLTMRLRPGAGDIHLGVPNALAAP